jgi:hypothetical protein
MANIADNTFITMMKSIGEMGSPCLRPLPWKKGSPGKPFMSTLVEEEDWSMVIQRIHLGPKPNCRRTLMRNAQDTLSKALATSSLSNKDRTVARNSVRAYC